MKFLLFFLFVFLTPVTWAWVCKIPANSGKDASRDNACYEGLLLRMEAEIKFEIAKKYADALIKDPTLVGNLYGLNDRRYREDYLWYAAELKKVQDLRRSNNERLPIIKCQTPPSD